MPEVMESIETITSIIEIFCEHRSPLSASTSPGNRGPYTSYILNVNATDLYIDQLIPNSGNYLIQPGQTIDLATKHNGISYAFRSRHISREVDEKGFPYHHISLPTQVTCSEKRSIYRTEIKRTERPSFHLSITPGEYHQAILEDISNNGARIRIQGEHSSLETDSLVLCEFNLADSDPLHCEAVVRHQKKLSTTQETLLGIEFSKLPDSTARALQKALMTQQRRNIRAYLPS